MYRLLQLNNAKFGNVRNYSPGNNGELSNFSERLCNLCHRASFKKDFVRGKATHTDLWDAIKKPRKKRNKSKKTYAELLMVSEKSLSECKVTVHKLKPEDLKMLALTNLKLSELYKLKEIYKNNKHIEAFTYNNLAADVPILNKEETEIDLSIPPIEQQEEIVNNNVETETVQNILAPNVNTVDSIEQRDNNDNSVNVEQILETEIIKIKKEDTFKPEIEADEHVEELAESETVETAKIEPKKKPFDPKMKQEIANKTLAAYIDMCSNLRLVYRAQNALNYHRYKAENGYPKINNVNVYNALLKGYGQNGDVEKLEEVINLMKLDNIRPNVQSFVSIFECIGRTSFLNSSLKNMRIFNKLMLQENINFDQIMTDGFFVNDQRAKVLQAIKLLKPGYTIKINDPNVQYENHLVDSLNHEDQLKFLSYDKNCGSLNENNQSAIKVDQNLIKADPNLNKTDQNLVGSYKKLAVTKSLLGDQNFYEKHEISYEKSLNSIEKSPQLNENSKNFNENTLNLKENRQNLLENSQSLKENSQSESKNLIENSSENLKSIFETFNKATKSYKNFIENTKKLSENNLIENSKKFVNESNLNISENQFFNNLSKNQQFSNSLATNQDLLSNNNNSLNSHLEAFNLIFDAEKLKILTINQDIFSNLKIDDKHKILALNKEIFSKLKDEDQFKLLSNNGSNLENIGSSVKNYFSFQGIYNKINQNFFGKSISNENKQDVFNKLNDKDKLKTVSLNQDIFNKENSEGQLKINCLNKDIFNKLNFDDKLKIVELNKDIFGCNNDNNSSNNNGNFSSKNENSFYTKDEFLNLRFSDELSLNKNKYLESQSSNKNKSKDAKTNRKHSNKNKVKKKTSNKNKNNTFLTDFLKVNATLLNENKLFEDIYKQAELLSEISIKDNLFSNENKGSKKSFTKSSIEDLIKEQLAIEKNGYVTVKSVEAHGEPSSDVLKYREILNEQLKSWEETALKAFNRDLFALMNRRSALNFEPFFKSIPPKDFITIITEEAVKLAQGSETYSPTVNQLYKELGSKVYLRYKVLMKQRTGALDKTIRIHKKFCQEHLNFNYDLDVLPEDVNNVNSRQKWQWIEHSFRPQGCTILTDHQEWVPTVLVTIGKFLYHIIMYDLKIDVNAMKFNVKHKSYLPAFYTIFRHQGRNVKEEIKPHPILSKLYRASIPETLTFPANEVPMKCPSIPWISPNVGGYLISPCEVMRLPHQAATQKDRLQNAKPNELYPSLDSLNQLSTIPWKVNQRILDVILEVFSKGGSDRLDVPEHPSNLPPPPPITPNMDKTERFQKFKAKLQYRRKKGEMYSLWCDCLYRLSLANHFRDETFWLPHNMDFRGRVYPVPPHLNYQGSDLARSMLVFAESRPLGPDGLNWLKLHLINLTGLKKREPVYERLIYANEIIDKILDSADHPLDGKKWWAESDEPWQTLACCIEIANALRSGNPEEYRTNFPIHQDGSCNGLQHYAALGRDSAGAFSVNLTPADVPQDVYSAVAGLVEERRKEDAENGLEIAQTLDGFVRRKVIKQTVMTTVYGVTRFGARLQIAKQLKDIEDFPKDSVWAASSYLTAKTFDSLRSMFSSTKEIQDWFTECAKLISSVGGQNVEWVTPLGLPIVQPYSKYKALPFNKVYEQYHMDKYEKPNVMKHKNAFPPNFIHSLDSTHMMLTSLYSERAGINFVSVHDCYWTHPSTVHIMNKICREQFVALHSEPILENLSVFLTEKYSYNDSDFANDGSVTDLTKRKLNKILGKLPPTGRFDINEVLNSVYFFS